MLPGNPGKKLRRQTAKRPPSAKNRMLEAKRRRSFVKKERRRLDD